MTNIIKKTANLDPPTVDLKHFSRKILTKNSLGCQKSRDFGNLRKSQTVWLMSIENVIVKTMNQM